MSELHYRHVWQWTGAAWDHVREGYVRLDLPGVFCNFPGAFEPPTFCSIGPPYVFERWFRWAPVTFGTGGTWEWAAERHNWGGQL